MDGSWNNLGPMLTTGKITRANMEKGEDVIDVGGMVRIIMCKLVDGDDIPIMGEHHHYCDD
jgi:hypothetical protein